MKTDPYLFFGGRCEEAIAFYRAVLGAQLRAFVRFGDMPGASPDGSDKVMHAELAIGDSTIFVSDAGRGPEPGNLGFSIALQAGDDIEAERVFAALAADGAVEVPLMSTPFASRFGKAADRFGTPWMITTPQPTV